MSITDAKKIIQLSDTVTILQSKVKELETENRRLSVRNTVDKEALREKVTEKKLHAALESVTTLEQDLRLRQRELDSLSYEVTLLRGVVNLQEASDEHVTAADALAQVSALQRDLLQTQSRADELESLAGEYWGRLKHETEELSKYKEHVLSLEGRIAHLSTSTELMSELKERNDRLEEKVKRQESAVRQTLATETDYLKSIRNEKELNANLSAALHALQKESETAKRTWHTGFEALEDAQSRIEEANLRIETLEESLQLLRDKDRELEASRRALATAESSCVHFSNQLDFKTEELRAAQDANKQLNGSYETLQEAHRALGNTCTEVQIELKHLRESDAAMEEQRSRHADHTDERLRSQEQLITALEDQCQQLASSNDGRGKEIKRLMGDLQRVTERLALVTVLPNTSSLISASFGGSSYGKIGSSPLRHQLEATPSPQRTSGMDGRVIGSSASKKLERLLGLDSPY